MSPKRFFQHAPLDSHRFGIIVMRGTIESSMDTKSLVEEIEQGDAELTIFRVPAGDTILATALQLRGHVVIHADTLVYYSTELSRSIDICTETQVERASEHHRKAITDIAANSFANYRSHYSANPNLPRELVSSGYIEWAVSRLESGSIGSQTWVVSDNGTIAGFATCDVGPSSVEIVLNAVHPSFERRGLYGMLLRHIKHHYAQHSLNELLISTQIWNYTVQRQWARAGLRLFKAYDTYHVDRRLPMGARFP
ncbi:GNAT family N-acetyltransferase [Stenotrophomonas rhizophila]|uniref:GNAT family N-acetyltransferase n=2 Tax=Stenotrophomonas rhizophila TaxID=216778 RepID=A0A7V7YFE3_9GAMM|nr:GNAT family N-acetyltransferase [Stenotrophomonas rhizophila]